MGASEGPGVAPVVLWPRTGPVSVMRTQGELVPVAEFVSGVGVVGACGEDPRQLAAVAMKAEVDARLLEDVAGLCEQVAGSGGGWHGDDVVVVVFAGDGCDVVQECARDTLAAVLGAGVDVMYDHTPSGEPLIRAVLRHSCAGEELVGLSAQWADESATYEAFVAPIADERPVAPGGPGSAGYGRQVPVLEHFFGEQASQLFVLIYSRREADVFTDLHDDIVEAHRHWLEGFAAGLDCGGVAR